MSAQGGSDGKGVTCSGSQLKGGRSSEATLKTNRGAEVSKQRAADAVVTFLPPVIFVYISQTLTNCNSEKKKLYKRVRNVLRILFDLY